jgi:hypothetical protein
MSVQGGSSCQEPNPYMSYDMISKMKYDDIGVWTSQMLAIKPILPEN